MRPREVLGRVPLRLKVTAAFVGAMGVVMAVIGVLVYFEFRRELDAGIDAALRARGGDLTALTRDGEAFDLTSERPPDASAGSFGQVLDARGRVLDGAGRPLDPVRGPAGVRCSSPTSSIGRSEDRPSSGGGRRLGSSPSPPPGSRRALWWSVSCSSNVSERSRPWAAPSASADRWGPARGPRRLRHRLRGPLSG